MAVVINDFELQPPEEEPSRQPPEAEDAVDEEALSPTTPEGAFRCRHRALIEQRLRVWAH